MQDVKCWLQKDFEHEREKVTQDMLDVVCCVPDIVKQALQPMETTVSEISMVLACVSQMVATVTHMENSLAAMLRASRYMYRD